MKIKYDAKFECLDDNEMNLRQLDEFATTESIGCGRDNRIVMILSYVLTPENCGSI